MIMGLISIIVTFWGTTNYIFPFYSHTYPFAWYGLILFLDGLLWWRWNDGFAAALDLRVVPKVGRQLGHHDDRSNIGLHGSAHFICEVIGSEGSLSRRRVCCDDDHELLTVIAEGDSSDTRVAAPLSMYW